MSGFDIGGPGIGPRTRLLGELREGGAPPLRTPGSDFGNALSDAISHVGELGNETGAMTDALARGEPVEIHELMVAMDKSDVAFNLMLEIRNKIVEAWETLSRSVV
jgi:flagellar hook-basal body complex protein FliE